MPSFIKQSILYKFLNGFFIKCYRSSFFKSVLEKFDICFKNSFLYIKFKKYINKSPYFLSSFSYKIFRKFIKLLDKFVDLIHDFFVTLITTSEIYNKIGYIKMLNINKKLLIISILIGSLNFGYILGCMFFNTIDFMIICTLLALALIVYVFSLNTNFYRNCFIYKFIKYLF